MLEMIDSHVHLNDPAFQKDLPEIVGRMAKAGVTGVINVGYDLASSRRAVEQAHSWPVIHAAVGVHPHDAASLNEEVAATIRGLANDSRVVAIGETGLDYYRNLSPRDCQKKTFYWHLNLARELRLPVIIHDREAHQDTLRILKKVKPSPAGGVLHCFSGSWELARDCLALGFHISFAGPVTYKNAHKLREVAKRVPLERLLVETDAPFLTPEPYRGQRNQPGYVERIVATIANIRGLEEEEVRAATAANARRLFRI